MNKWKYFKNRYFLAVYDNETADNLLFLCNNAREFAERFALSPEATEKSLATKFSKRGNPVPYRIKGHVIVLVYAFPVRKDGRPVTKAGRYNERRKERRVSKRNNEKKKEERTAND